MAAIKFVLGSFLDPEPMKMLISAGPEWHNHK